MLEKQPLTYIEKFDIFSEYFTPFIRVDNEKRIERVFERDMKIEFVRYKNQFAMVFKVIDHVIVILKENNNNYYKESNVHTVFVSQYNETGIKPSLEQSAMICALGEGELHGNAADNMVQLLLNNCIILNPKSNFVKYFPIIHENFINIHNHSFKNLQK